MTSVGAAIVNVENLAEFEGVLQNEGDSSLLGHYLNLKGLRVQAIWSVVASIVDILKVISVKKEDLVKSVVLEILVIELGLHLNGVGLHLEVKVLVISLVDLTDQESSV